MASQRRVSKGKKINPHFWVFCEGKSEEEYVRYLRSEYRLQVEIVSKVAGCDISEEYIRNYKAGKPTHEKDKDFLIYDADVKDVIGKLKKFENVELIASNPSIELWFLLHYKNQTSSITTEYCIRELSNRNNNTYKKGVIDSALKRKLMEKLVEACNRSKKLSLFNNPSSNMYKFIEALEKAKNDFSFS
jgi:hypothetical protein